MNTSENQPTISEDEKIELLRKDCLKRDLIWKAMSVLSVMIAVVYFVLYVTGIVPRDLDILAYLLIALVILIVIFTCVYMLPVVLKINKHAKKYSNAYKNTYLKPVLEDAFKSADYDPSEKVSIKDITEMSMLKKAKSAVANDCIEGSYKGTKFSRFDLALSYDKEKASSDCVLITCKIKTNLSSELQIVSKDFKTGSTVYQMPEGYTKVMSGRDNFDKRYNMYAKNESEAKAFMKDSFANKLVKTHFGGPIAIFAEKGKVYMVIRRKKDVMEAPLYKKVSRAGAEKEAKEEIDIIKSWIGLVNSEI